MNNKYFMMSMGLLSVFVILLIIDSQTKQPVVVDKIIRLVYPDWKPKHERGMAEMNGKRPMDGYNPFSTPLPAIDRPDKAGNPPLVRAVAKGDSGEIEKLIKKGADLNSQDSTGNTPLNLAVYLGNENAVNKLLMNGANPNIGDDTGMTPTAKAARLEMIKIAQMLLERGADPNRQNNDGQTPLMLAAQYGYDDMVDLLIQNNASVNIKDKLGRTALMNAAANGFPKVVVKLLSMGADKKVRDTGGQTAQDYAFRFGHEDVAIILQGDMGTQGAVGAKPMPDISIPPSVADNGALVPPPATTEPTPIQSNLK